MKRKITVFGGDSRQIYASEYLEKQGYDVMLFGFELFNGNTVCKSAKDISKAMKSDIILFPLPCSRNGKTAAMPFADCEYTFEDTVKRAYPGTLFLAGKVPFLLQKAVKNADCEIIDYFECEELTLKNALLTGEGILAILLNEIPKSVFGLKAAITGYGRVSYYTAKMLKSLGADVTVFARNPVQLAKAESNFMKVENINNFSEKEQNFDCLINTVPENIINEAGLNALNRDCLLIEAASMPFGIAGDIAENKGFKLIKAQSLPGKTAPESAGKIIADTADSLIKEATKWTNRT